MKRKLLVIGWDAADWKVINPLIEQGVMPNLEKLVNNGVIGNIATLDPPLSPMLWTSIATGKRPYKHGIVGFAEIEEGEESVSPITIRNRKAKAIWNILNQHNYRTHVVGWWPSHPAEKINGVCVSNFFQKASAPLYQPWKLHDQTIHPDSLKERIAQMRIHPQELTENHIAAFVPDCKKINQKEDKYLTPLAQIIAENASVHAAATYLLETEPWDFMAVYYDGIDHFNHAFMKFHPPHQPHVDKEMYELYKDVVTGGYRFHDMMLGRLLELAGPDTTVMLLSDHGFHPDHLRRKKINPELAGPMHEHSQFGIVCLSGPGIKKDELIYGASLLDITPTILNLYNLPVARDMDGKVLSTIYSEPNQVTYIDTYEDGKAMEIKPTKTEGLDKAVLQQMIDLGYVEEQGENKEENFKRLREENAYFLARAYMDGGKYAEAATMLMPLFDARPQSQRIYGSLISCYNKLQQYDKAEKILQQLKLQWQEKYEQHLKEAAEKNATPDVFRYPVNILFQEAMIHYHSLQYETALPLFLQIKDSLQNQSNMNLFIGNIYFNLRNLKKAREYFEKELEINFDSFEAHLGLGLCAMRSNNLVRAINCFLDSVGLQFHQPLAHYHLGETFFRKKNYEEAVSAFEICLQQNPALTKARARLIMIYQNHVENNSRLTYHNTYAQQHPLPTIYIVSGLPRSGTSMMMRMLEAGGLPVFTDKQRMADENNPEGYYEHASVLELARNHEWLDLAEGKVVKVVAPLLQFLPMTFSYKIIFMKREIDEIMLSQQTMLQRLGKNKKNAAYNVQLKQQYQTLLADIEKWKNKFTKNITWLEVDYNQMQQHTGILKDLENFAGKVLDTDRMNLVYNPELYRSKINQ